MANSYCFIYWDNSNLFIPAQDVAREKEGEYARCRVRLDFTNLMALAQSGRPVKKIRAAGSIPPSLHRMWGKLEAEQQTHISFSVLSTTLAVQNFSMEIVQV